MSSTEMKVLWDGPATTTEPITHYTLYYYDTRDDGDEEEIRVVETDYTITELRKFNEYSFRVVANNKNGPGTSSDEVTARTHSDGTKLWVISRH